MSIFSKWLIAASTKTTQGSDDIEDNTISCESSLSEPQHVVLNVSDKLNKLLEDGRRFDDHFAKTNSANDSSKVHVAYR